VKTNTIRPHLPWLRFQIPFLQGRIRFRRLAERGYLRRQEEIKVTAEVPGLEEKDIEVLLNQGVLTLKLESAPGRRTRTTKWMRDSIMAF